MPILDPVVKRIASDDDTDDLLEILQSPVPIKHAPNTIVIPKPTEVQKQKRRSPMYRLNGASLILGADPEFVVTDRRGNPENCGAIDRLTSFGGIGHDHSGRCAEFRPNPGMPKDLIDNIRGMIVQVRDSKPGKKLFAGGCSEYDIACGGHIHFNIQRLNLSNVHETPNDGEDQSLIHALDSFLGRKMLRMEGAKRAKPNSTPYGFAGDWREQPHGFEYRTPPSFIGEPVFAEAVFAVAHRIAKVWLSNNDAFSEMKGRMAKRREYALLVPTEAEIPATVDRDYWRNQIATFIRMAWDSDFKLNNQDMIEKWTAGIPVKALWRQINLHFPEGEDGMMLEGSVQVAADFHPEIQTINVVTVPEWQNLREENILLTRAVYESFNVRPRKRELERHGLAYVAVDGNEFKIGIPHSITRQSSRYTHRSLERFFQSMGMELDLQILG